jgi:hypothetical protein
MQAGRTPMKLTVFTQPIQGCVHRTAGLGGSLLGLLQIAISAE